MRWRLEGERLERRLALAVATPFTPRFSVNTTGDITIAANTLMTAGSGTTTDIANAQNGIGSKVNNNDFTMAFVNIDSGAGLFNSSSADVVAPDGAEVLWAGLYWGGRTDTSTVNGQTAQRLNVQFRAPGGSYQPLTGTLIGTTSSSYQAFKDVTTLVKAAGGAGTYSVGNVQAISNKSDYYAGWSLVVAYRAQGEPPRNLTVFDGYASVTSSDPSVNIGISGFKAPLSGPVKATLGFVAYEGDLGYTGDKVLFKSGSATTATQLSDAANPGNNFFNSTISNRGSLVSTKNPDYVNQMGFDADLVKADGIIKNGDTSATISLSTGGETYYPGVVTSAIDLYAPNIIVDKDVANVTDPGNPVQVGDVLRYTITVRNDAAVNDTAVNVLLNDAIPANTAYKAGTLVISAGANSGTKTDAQDGDQAEVVGSSVRFQLGTGAAGFGTAGGSLAPGASTTVTFEVTVTSLPSDNVIENVANVSYSDSAKLFSLIASGFADIATIQEADISVTKVDVPASGVYVPGQTITYRIVVTNNSPTVNVSGIRVFDEMPSQVDMTDPAFGWTAVYTNGSGAASGTGNIDGLINLNALGTATFTITAPVRVGSFGNLSNSVEVTPPAGVFDPDESNNTATDVNALRMPANLQVKKTVRDMNGGVVVGGDTLRYTIVVTNPSTNPDAANESAINVTLSDVVPANTAYAGNLTTSNGSVAYSFATNTITGNFDPIAMGESVTIIFDVTVSNSIGEGVVITNTANVTGTGAISGLTFTDDDSVGVVTPPGADLVLVKTGPASFVPGSPVTFTIVVRNDGPSDVTGATVTDTVDSRLTGVTWSAVYSTGSSGSLSGFGNAISANVNLKNGGTATFTVTGTANSNFPDSDVLTNTATVTNPAGYPDPNPDDNTSSTTSTPTSITDLAALKTSSASTYKPGQPITYTITVTNNGPSFATQASVIDTLDPAIISSALWTAAFSGSGSSGNLFGSGSIDEIIDLAAGGSVIYTIVAQTRSEATTTLVNTVTAGVSKYSNDPNPNNNTSTVSTPPSFAPAIIVGNDATCDSTPLVRVLDPTTGAVKSQFLAYEASFRGGVRVYGADVTGDGVEEIITAPGAGRPGEIRVFSQDGVELPAYRTLPFGAGFRGGVDVAVGSVTGPGRIEFVASQSSGGNLVRTFTVTPGAADPVADVPSRQFQPFGPRSTGGASVATADITTASGANISEIIVGSGVGMRNTVVAYNAVPVNPVAIGSMNPLGGRVSRGVSVSRVPGATAGTDRVMVTGGPGTNSQVETWRYTNAAPRFIRDGAFAAFAGSQAGVFAAALDADNVFSVQGAGGTINGVRKNTAITGGTQSTLPSSTTIRPPQRISVLRR